MNVLAVCGILAIVAAAPDRPEFAARARQINKGDTSETVRSLLGAPEKVMKEDIDAARLDADEIWYYGIHGDSHFPTLGRVYFERAQAGLRVVDVYGAGRLRASLGVKEPLLRELMSSIGDLTDVHAYQFDPLAYIRVANTLNKAGHSKAVMAINEFRRICPDDHGHNAAKLAVLIRVAFKRKKNAPPWPKFPLARPLLATPKAMSAPTFPVIIADDVPYMLPLGYEHSGQPSNLDDDLQFVANHTQLRKRALSPSALPIETVLTIQRDGLVKHPSIIIAQLLLTIRHVYDSGDDVQRIDRAHALGKGGALANIRQELIKKKIEWNGAKHCFEETKP